MPTPTARLGLLKPSTADQFVTADIAANWQKIDDNPGVYLCTSSTRPAWGAAHKGREIMETDTLLKWIWTGSTAAGGFERAAPTGLLKTTSGAWAVAQRTTAATVTKYAGVGYTNILSLANVVVPPGKRTLMITATWPLISNPLGRSALAVFRTLTNNGTPRLSSWWIAGDNSAAVSGATGSGGSFVLYEKDGLDPGVYNYSIQFATGYNGTSTSTMNCDTVTPLELAVIEI